MCVERKDLDGKELAEFERKLRQAMRQRVAPAGLKQRVLARAREQRQARRGRWWMVQRVAASVTLAAALVGVAAYRQVEERRKGEQAREQVLTAMRITSRALGRVNERLAENSR
jgi:hypothetical protein